MSMPSIPDINPKIDIDRKDVINLLLASIAFEELGLAHLINAEAEKIQAVLGTLEGGNSFNSCSINDLLNINKSVRKTLEDIIKKEMLLQFKLQSVLEVPDFICNGKKHCEHGEK